MEMYLLIFVVNILCICKSKAEARGCEIELQSKIDPLVFKPHSTQLLYPPPEEDVIQLKIGDVVRFACPGTVVLVNGNTTRQTIVDSTCTSDKRFKIHENVYSWSEVSCGGRTTSVVRCTNQYCEANGKLLTVGFDIGDKEFFEIMRICFDSTMQNPLYSTYNLTASIGNSVKGTPRPTFRQDTGFYNIGKQSVKTLYRRSHQRKNINRQLGLSNTDRKYISNGQLYFLSRGHLTAKIDFVYPAQQNATFRYINAAPQWQSFNGHNWNFVEMNTRAYATINAVDLQIWTGTYGTSKLPHEFSEQNVNLYLYSDGVKKAVPVPALFWKLIYDPFSYEGIVLIGINNPYEKNITKHIICPDISDSTHSWFENIERKNNKYGYVYACAVPEFKNVVKYAPKLKILNLLL